MFIRTKYDPDRDRYRVQIVKSVRHGDLVRQKIVRHVGIAKSKTELEPLRQLGEFILAEIQQTHSPQQELFSVKEYARLLTHARQAKQAEKLGVDVGECREQARLTVGVRQAYGQLWETLGLTRVLGARRQSSNQILRELVLARIAQPRSKRGTVMDLSRDAGVTLSLDRVYQTMDYIDDKVIDKIQTLVGRYTQKVDPEGMHVVFMDCTTLYFEQDQEDELRLKGRSKDGKSHRVQIILALMVTHEGLPVGYEVFPGNIYEGKTLIQLVDDWQVRFPGGRMTVVADAGLLSAENQAALQARQIAYILGYRMKSASAVIKQQILDHEAYQSWDGLKPQPHHQQVWRYREIEHGPERIIATYSSKRARKDKHQRMRALDKLKRKLALSQTPASVGHKGMARFLDFPDGKVVINEDKLAAAAQWDGLHAIIAWGNDHFSAQDLLNRYRQLWTIERSFRTNKHDLRIRPIFHFKPARIRAHLAICYLAFACVQHLGYRLRQLGYPMSPEVVRRELNALQMSILWRPGTSDQYVMPSRATTEAKRIYRCLGLNWNTVPFALPKGRASPPSR